MGPGFREATSVARCWSDCEQRARFHKAGSTERGGSSSFQRPPLGLGGAHAHVPLGCGCLPLWFGVGLSPSRMPFSSGFSFACYRKTRSAVPCTEPPRPVLEVGGTCTCAYARAEETRMRVGASPPPPLVWGGALSAANAFFVWSFFCVASQHVVRCAVHSAALAILPPKEEACRQLQLY